MELTIKFKKSHSPYFRKALAMVRKWNPAAAAGDRPGHWVVTFSGANIHDAAALWNIVKGWKSTRARLNGRPAYALPFQRILDCYCRGVDDDHCFGRNDGGDQYLFGCRLVYLPGGRHWWSFGSMKGSTWVVDKRVLSARIRAHVEGKNVDLCPAFSFARTDRVILNLPYSIDVEYDDTWEVVNGWRWGRFGPVSVRPVETGAVKIPVAPGNPDFLPVRYCPEFAKGNLS